MFTRSRDFTDFGRLTCVKAVDAERQYARCMTNGSATLPSLPTPSVISVVDDDASMRASMDNLLRSRGYVVHTFGSAEEFLRSPRLSQTSCVIADVQMPAMNGLEMLAIIRMRGYAAPFIFITAFPDESVRARALKAGATCFLAKPCAPTNLIECVDAALAPRGGDVGT
jgi:FixJ family two-component response regulator